MDCRAPQGLIFAAGLAHMAPNCGGRIEMPADYELRRVVTTVDKADKAVVLFDGENPQKMVRPDRATVSRVIWTTDKSPADISGTTDRSAVKIGIAPAKGGTVFRIVDFPPMPPEVANLPLDYLTGHIGDSAPKRHKPPRHPLMHATRTIDYAIIMSGEIDMLLDDSEVHFKAGDVLVQQGTNHAWVNRGTELCRIAFILIDSEEP
jgi:hypothetical protein